MDRKQIESRMEAYLKGDKQAFAGLPNEEALKLAGDRALRRQQRMQSFREGIR